MRETIKNTKSLTFISCPDLVGWMSVTLDIRVRSYLVRHVISIWKGPVIYTEL